MDRQQESIIVSGVGEHPAYQLGLPCSECNLKPGTKCIDNQCQVCDVANDIVIDTDSVGNDTAINNSLNAATNASMESSSPSPSLSTSQTPKFVG